MTANTETPRIYHVTDREGDDHFIEAIRALTLEPVAGTPGPLVLFDDSGRAAAIFAPGTWIRCIASRETMPDA